MEGKKDKNGRKKAGLKPVLVGLIVLLLAAAGAASYMYVKKVGVFAEEALVQQRTAFADKGSIEKSVEGSGAVQSSTRREVSPKVVSTIESINYKAGDIVQKGDVMFELDDTEALLNIEDMKNNIGQTELSLSNIRQSIAALTVKAPISGKVTEVNTDVDSNVGGGASILTITDTSKVKILFQFGGNEIPNIAIGHKATVTMQEFMSSYEGKVTYVSNKPYSSDGVMIYDVEITLDNEGAFTEGMKASARLDIGNVIYSSLDFSQTKFANTKIVKNDSGGKVKNIKVKANQFVNAGDVLVELENDSLKLNLNTTQLKLDNLKAQLAIKEKSLEYYKLLAPCNGTVISQDASIGDTVSAGSNLAVVADMDSLVFDINIDELDVSDIKVGQEVSVTADAVADTLKNPLKGAVSEISMEGTSSNGVTTYPVTITLEKSDKLKTGMNVNGEIKISSKENVLRVPVEAVQTMGDASYVYVKGAAMNRQNSSNDAGGQVPSGDGQSRNGLPQQQGDKPDAATAGEGTGKSGFTQPQEGDSSSTANAGGNSSQNGQPPQGSGGSGRRSSGNAGRMSGGNFDSYYTGAVLTKVETGISNDTYIEIVSGLTEGQIIVLPEAGADSGSNENTQQGTRMQGGGSGMPAGGFQGGGGGMPAGGFQGGGGPGF